MTQNNLGQNFLFLKKCVNKKFYTILRLFLTTVFSCGNATMRGFVRPSVRPSVPPSIRLLVHPLEAVMELKSGETSVLDTFWAAAQKGLMTCAFTHMGKFLLLRLSPLPTQILASRPKSQPQGPLGHCPAPSINF